MKSKSSAAEPTSMPAKTDGVEPTLVPVETDQRPKTERLFSRMAKIAEVASQSKSARPFSSSVVKAQHELLDVNGINRFKYFHTPLVSIVQPGVTVEDLTKFRELQERQGLRALEMLKARDRQVTFFLLPFFVARLPHQLLKSANNT